MAAIHRPALPATRAAERPRMGSGVLWIAGAVIVVVAMLQVNQFSRLTSTGYEIGELERQRSAKLAENHQLEAEVAALSSLARVDLEARTRLGMEPAEQRMYIEVNQPVPEQQLLPTRYLAPSQPADGAAASETQTNQSFLEQLRELLPF